MVGPFVSIHGGNNAEDGRKNHRDNQAHKRKLQRNRQCLRNAIGDRCVVGAIGAKVALNKADLASPEQIALLRTVFPGAVPLSAYTGWGVDALRVALEDMLPRPRVAVDAVLPYSAGSLVHRIHEEGEVEREEYVDAGTRIVARVDEALAAVIARAAVGGTVGDAAVSGQ